MKNHYWVMLLSVWLGSCVYLFHTIYADTRQKTIDELNHRQMIHAEQAAQSIENFFDHWITYLTSLSESEHIIELDDKGREEIELIYRINLEQISAVTRVDANGKILHTVPFNQKVIGMDISHQKHVKESMKTHKPVVSDVFRAVQGYDAVAVPIPVFNKKIYCGTLTVLINVQAVAKKITENIHLGKTGYAWVISKDGTELYCPVPGHIGRTVYENCRDFPTIIGMAEKMVKGEKGVTTYFFDQIREKKTVTIKKHAVYMPIRVGNTFWSVVVASSESEVLSGIDSFGRKLLAVIGMFFTGSFFFIYYGIRVRRILREEALRRNSEKTARALLNIPNAAAFLIDRNAILIDANETMAKWLKMSVSEIIGKCIWDIFPPEVTMKRKAHFEGILRDKKQVIYEDERQGIWRESIITPILDDIGEVSKVAVFAFDITWRKEAEAENEKLQQQLLQSQKMESIGRLAGGVAHDFNNMLGVIIGHVELLLYQVKIAGHTDTAAELSAGLSAISKAANRSADLTRQLLAFARKQIVTPQEVNLNEAVEEMLSMLERLIGENIELAWIPDQNIGKVMIDPSQIDQIMANLCINARDAIQYMGKITIETGNSFFDDAYCADHVEALPGSHIMITVSDNGCGMDKETLSQIFDPFFTTKDINKGTGLGLASVYGIIRQNNGFINVYSENGKGTTFRIYLPEYDSHKDKYEDDNYDNSVDAKNGSTYKAGPSPVTGDETILLVEDEEWLLELGETMLKRLGYTVLSASTPEEAINITQTYSGEIDLLITDVIMPEMNGRELAKKLLEVRQNMQCLFMSGYTANVIAHHGVLDSGVNFIQKPFSIQELGQKVREALKN
ncbi:MAG: response regulator, partial [Desulfamplus sp.]|nr:response regulator [Desulfamplus sp.]